MAMAEQTHSVFHTPSLGESVNCELGQETLPAHRDDATSVSNLTKTIPEGRVLLAPKDPNANTNTTNEEQDSKQVTSVKGHPAVRVVTPKKKRHSWPSAKFSGVHKRPTTKTEPPRKQRFSIPNKKNVQLASPSCGKRINKPPSLFTNASHSRAVQHPPLKPPEHPLYLHFKETTAHYRAQVKSHHSSLLSKTAKTLQSRMDEAGCSSRTFLDEHKAATQLVIAPLGDEMLRITTRKDEGDETVEVSLRERLKEFEEGLKKETENLRRDHLEWCRINSEIQALSQGLEGNGAKETPGSAEGEKSYAEELKKLEDEYFAEREAAMAEFEERCKALEKRAEENERRGEEQRRKSRQRFAEYLEAELKEQEGSGDEDDSRDHVDGRSGDEEMDDAAD